MQEELERKTVALVFKASKFTAETFAKAVKMALDKGIEVSKEPELTGEMSVKDLVGKGGGAKSIEVADDAIKTFRKVANKYKVDFAIHKDDSEQPPKFIVFFQGKDADVIKQTFKEFVYEHEKEKSEKSIREELKKKQKEVDKNKEKAQQKARKRNKDLSR